MKRKETLTKEVGKRLMKEREGKGLSREALAQKANISDKYLYDIEAGNKCMSIFILHKLVTVLEVSLDWLIMGDKLKK